MFKAIADLWSRISRPTREDFACAPCAFMIATGDDRELFAEDRETVRRTLEANEVSLIEGREPPIDVRGPCPICGFPPRWPNRCSAIRIRPR